MWRDYVIPTTLDQALDVLADRAGAARVVAGGTDLLLEVERGVRQPEVLVDITRVPGLDQVMLGDDGFVHVGALVTHNQVVASQLCCERGLPLAQACLEVGAPQIRNRGTVAGNVITASPANDTITPLMALDAQVTLCSRGGSRVVPLRNFYVGVRRTVMAPDELLTRVSFVPLGVRQRGVFLKLGLRRAQAIAVINVAVVVCFADDVAQVVERAVLTLGSVAPRIVHAEAAEQFLVGRVLDATTIGEAALLAEQAASPIDDVRGSARYRRGMVTSLVARALRLLADGEERRGWPTNPVLLGGQSRSVAAVGVGVEQGFDAQGSVIEMVVNGSRMEFRGAHGLTLLDALRDVAGLTGTKKGCAEGECGSCTVWLDGVAIMSCLTPAGQAHGAEVTTIEGLARDGQLHPVQQSFIERGAVQCGYCTPGLIMAAAKLLEECPTPSVEEAQQAIAGNLCRCTGYAKVLEAIVQAGPRESL